MESLNIKNEISDSEENDTQRKKKKKGRGRGNFQRWGHLNTMNQWGAKKKYTKRNRRKSDGKWKENPAWWIETRK